MAKRVRVLRANSTIFRRTLGVKNRSCKKFLSNCFLVKRKAYRWIWREKDSGVTKDQIFVRCRKKILEERM